MCRICGPIEDDVQVVYAMSHALLDRSQNPHQNPFMQVVTEMNKGSSSRSCRLANDFDSLLRITTLLIVAARSSWHWRTGIEGYMTE